MDAQQIYDTVLNGIRAQGKASVNENDECVYRSTDGCKCAFGLLITDEQYEPSMEHKCAPLVIEKYPQLAHLKEHSRLIDALQYAHDQHLTGKGMDAWEREMYEISRRYHLKYSRSIFQPLPQIDPMLPTFRPAAGGAQ